MLKRTATVASALSSSPRPPFPLAVLPNRIGLIRPRVSTKPAPNSQSSPLHNSQTGLHHVSRPFPFLARRLLVLMLILLPILNVMRPADSIALGQVYKSFPSCPAVAVSPLSISQSTTVPNLDNLSCTSTPPPPVLDITIHNTNHKFTIASRPPSL